MTTVLLNPHNAGFYELNSMVLAMGICYGGAAQIVAALWNGGKATPSHHGGLFPTVCSGCR
jgi:succinate-acetate transporter protein